MPEIQDRLPGEVILASYSNEIRDRAVMRYADATARDASNPVPATGDLAFLTVAQQYQIFNGVTWETYATQPDVDAADQVLSNRLDIYENQVYTAFERDLRGLTQSPQQVAELTVQVAGDYWAEFDGRVEYDVNVAAGLGSEPITFAWRINDLFEENIPMGSGGEGFHAASMRAGYPFIGLSVNDRISVYLETNSSSVVNPNLQDYVLRASQVPTGKMVAP